MSRQFIIINIFTFLLSITTFSQTEFDKPWLDITKAIILDPSHYDDKYEIENILTDSRIKAFIHKATEGESDKHNDAKYSDRKKIIKVDHKLLWGSFHIGRPKNPEDQVDHYLKITGKNDDELYALDIEPSNSMSVDETIKFINYFYKQMNRYPVLYCGKSFINMIVKTKNKKYFDIFSNCPLWVICPYNKMYVNFPVNEIWKTYTIWQFAYEENCEKDNNPIKYNSPCSDETMNYQNDTHDTTDKWCCPYKIDGTNSNTDIDLYNGTINDLINKWPNLK